MAPTTRIRFAAWWLMCVPVALATGGWFSVSRMRYGRDMNRLLAVILILASSAAACGGASQATPTAPTPANSATTPSGTSAAVTGVWTGTASDTSGSMMTGGLMGQSGMGSPTWTLAQTGSTVTGSISFSGMMGQKAGTFTGTMSGEDMTFMMDLPMGSMMSSGCTATAAGTAHLNGTTMVMTVTYGGSNSCTGPFANGQMTMTRR